MQADQPARRSHGRQPSGSQPSGSQPSGFQPNGRRQVRAFSLGLVAMLVLGAALAGCAGAAKTPKVLFVTPTPSPTPEPTPTPEITPSPTPTPVPTPVPTPTTGPCNGASLAISISTQSGLGWQTVSGHQMANFELKNTGSTVCLVSSKSQPLLLNGDNSPLITGSNPGSSTSLRLQPGATLKATVQTGNLCAAPPLIAPLQVAFVMPGTGLVIAAPASQSDMGGAPPCTGDATKPSGDIQMSSWAP